MGNAAAIMRPAERARQASKRTPTSERPLKWRGRGVRDLGSREKLPSMAPGGAKITFGEYGTRFSRISAFKL